MTVYPARFASSANISGNFPLPAINPSFFTAKRDERMPTLPGYKK
jgi:hypothetical protein